jgi:dihydrofolate reductase/thymidylate synthase
MINIIVAVDKNFGIGKNNNLPWYISEEMKIFKKKTYDQICVVGRKTFETLPVLKNRKVIQVSRKDLLFDEVVKEYNDFFVIGGADLYSYVLKNHKINSKIHISFIKNEYDCDTYFDKYLLKDFYILSKEYYNEFDHCEMIYKKYGEYQYLELLKDVLENGEKRVGRNGSIISDFSKHLKFDLREGFPLLTTKKMFLKGIIEELLFFLRGDTDTKILEKQGINIWKGNTNREFLDSNGFTERKEGLMGPMYGNIWRYYGAEYNEESGKPLPAYYKFDFLDVFKKTEHDEEKIYKSIDQIKNVINLIKTDPSSRRILLTTYNPAQVDNGVLYPCHSIIIQFYVQDGYLDMFCYNRSSDLFLGLPFNIASSSLLLMIIAKLTNLTPRYFNLSLGDVHIYSNHVEQVKEQINRIPYISPRIILPDIMDINDIKNITYKDFELFEYSCYPSIKAEMIA